MQRSHALAIGVSLLGALLLLSALEGAIALALRTPPGSGPEHFERARRSWYMDHERHIVQYRPECAEHDPELGYRLRPGSCRFRNREFDTELHVNSLGVRDSEAALEAPDVVVTGDSFAMGWGVEQSETLAAALARATGERTLNLAVSSYGTARQLIGLRRADLGAAHSLVLQYCENDYVENRTFQLRGGQLGTMSAQVYETLVREHLASTNHFPGRYVLRFFPLWWRSRSAAPAEAPRPCALDADAFLDVLEWAEPPPLPGDRALRVVVFEGRYDRERPACFASELQRQAAERTLPSWIASLRVLDSSRLLEADDRFPLDGHWRASGHAKLATAVAAVLSGADGLSE